MDGFPWRLGKALPRHFGCAPISGHQVHVLERGTPPRGAYPGKGRLTITGQLGDVMQESAQAALSWVRAHAEKLGLEQDWFR